MVIHLADSSAYEELNLAEFEILAGCWDVVESQSGVIIDLYDTVSVPADSLNGLINELEAVRRNILSSSKSNFEVTCGTEILKDGTEVPMVEIVTAMRFKELISSVERLARLAHEKGMPLIFSGD